MFISKNVRMLCDDLIDNHHEWSDQKCRYVRGSTNTHIWIANGLFFIDFNNGMGSFNIFEKLAIKRAIAKSLILNAINEKPIDTKQ